MSLSWNDHFSEKDIALAREYSPAIDRYLSLLNIHSDTNLDSKQKIKIHRHSAWVECSLNQVLKKLSTREVCHAWSLKTMDIVDEAWSNFSGHENMALFALGKLGALELNLSSDIDIIMVSLEPPKRSQLKFYKEFNELLSSHSELGFCYRLDYNLRPGGRLGPPICSVKQFDDYYWTQGATWERIALHRLRPICGNQEVIKAVLATKKSFCYRKFLDYSVLEDIKNIRQNIQEEQNNDESAKHLKLAVGGIRDIELYINSLQVIHGGKNTQLQASETSTALDLLLKHKILSKQDHQFLLNTYWRLREIENLVQLKDDLQTHLLPTAFKSPEGNVISPNELPFSKVDQIVSELLGQSKESQSLMPGQLDQQMSWLKSKGFESLLVDKLWPKIMALTVYAKKNQKDEVLRSRFLFHFIDNVCQFGLDKNLSLNLLSEFIKSIRPKRSFYHLLEQEPNIVKELAIILSSSPYLGQLLAAKPELLDSFLLKQFPTFSNDLQKLLEELGDYKQLNQILLSGQLLAQKEIENLTFTCSETADKITKQLLFSLKKKFPDNSIEIIKLGKWGGHDLGLLSDLDFIFVTDKKISDHDIKISRRFINMLTNRQKGGEIYPVDLRLRPQSGSGKLITQKSSLIKYLNEEAKIWERQSYLRATPLNDKSFRQDILQALFTRPIKDIDENEMLNIKQQLFLENKTQNQTEPETLDLKYSPGGLIDVEFSCQTYLLKNNLKPISGNTLEMIKQISNYAQQQLSMRSLHENYLKLRYYEQISQILTQHQTTFLEKNSDSFLRLSHHLGINKDKLFPHLEGLLLDNQKLVQNMILMK